jgi:hypothetical protein
MITPDLSRATWRKSSYSTSHANCVEVAVAPYSDPCSVGVRDSKNAAGPALMFPVSSWIGFITER